MKHLFLTLLFLVVLNSTNSFILADSKTVYKIDIKKEIGSSTWLYIQKGFEEAHKEFGRCHINPYEYLWW